MIKKVFKNQSGQATVTEIIILIAVVITIAVAAVTVTSNTTKQVDDKYRAEVKSFFMQGE
jgi:hypothetical protein